MKRSCDSLGNFLRRIAFDYVRYGYHRYALREIPKEKDPGLIDDKVCRAYGVTSCRTKRHRRRAIGKATVEYLRWDHTFVLLATDGTNAAFERLRSFDIAQSPLHLRGYTIGIRPSGVSVELSRSELKKVRQAVKEVELQAPSKVEDRVTSFPIYRFPGVLTQLYTIVREVNLRRKAAGLLPARPEIRPQLEARYRGRRKKVMKNVDDS